MTDPARERLTVFDAAGHPVGAAERREVYARSLWHATTAVALRSTDRTQLYVHRRRDCQLSGVTEAG